jgi:Protein of unknown function (DUF3501)
MKKIELKDLKNIADYEKMRERMRAEIIELKKRRRVQAGENITLLFENRETVLFQIQEMMRTERIVHDDKIQDEIDAYNAILPADGEVSATLFIEIPDLFKLRPEEVRRTVNRFQGLDEGYVSLVFAGWKERAHFEGGHSKEEKMAAVHYVRFRVPPEGREALLDPKAEVRLVVDHPKYQAEAVLAPPVRQELLADLTSAT